MIALCAALAVVPGFNGDYRTIRALAQAPSTIYAATSGGLVQIRDGKSMSFGWKGLIAGRGLEDVWIDADQDGVFASAGTRVARWDGSRFRIVPNQTPRVAKPVEFTTQGLLVPPKATWSEDGSISPPVGSKGTHVSAVSGTSDSLTANWFGDGLYAYDGLAWSRLANQPDELKSTVAISCGANVAAATQDGNLWLQSGDEWVNQPLPNGPRGSIYNLIQFQGNLVAGSFEHGINAYQNGSWTQLAPGSPRDLVVFGDSLYVRRTTGEVDRFDGRRWSTNVFSWLPRGSATCLAVGNKRLLVGQYGGWSETDGKRWEHHLRVPELVDQPVTALGASPKDTWVGTQRTGLVRFNQKTQAASVLDQRSGLGDDWVRRILVDNNGVTVGLFLTGAYRWNGRKFDRLTPGIKGEATGFAESPKGYLYVGSREGVWRIRGRQAVRVETGGVDNLEVQALIADQTGVWAGTPNGIGLVVGFKPIRKH